jgi:hypothetical protein
MKSIGSWIFLLCLCCNSSVKSQSIEDFLDSYEGENSIPYIQPIADLITANLNTGIRDWSRIDTSFYIRFGIVAMSSYPSSSQRTFTGKTDGDFQPQQTATAPTIIGPVEPVIVEGINGTGYVFPGGYNLKSLPLAAPQVTIGGILNSEFTARYFAFKLDDDLGKISLLGLGIRHSLNAYFETLPFDLSVGYFYHQFKDDPYFNINSSLASLHIGKSGKSWSTQFILGYQNSSTRIKYSFNSGDEVKNIDLTLKNKNKVIAEVAAAIRILIFNIHGSVSYSGPITWSLGLGLHF